MADNRNFLALEDGLYKGTTLEEIISITSHKLMEIGTIDSMNRAIFLQRYYDVSTKESYRKVMVSSFNSIVMQLKKTVLKDIPFEIAVRIKSLISLWEKVEKISQQNRDYDEILDILGMRIIIEDMDEVKASNTLANVANEILDLAISKQWSISPLKMNTEDFDSTKHPEIIIPTNDVKPEYMEYRKNYSRYPKSNGYQSIHLNIQMKNRFHVEIQIRTWMEHENCENPYLSFKNLNHEAYKAKEYANSKMEFRIEDVKAIKLGHSGSILDPYGIINPRILLIHRHTPF